MTGSAQTALQKQLANLPEFKLNLPQPNRPTTPKDVHAAAIDFINYEVEIRQLTEKLATLAPIPGETHESFGL